MIRTFPALLALTLLGCDAETPEAASSKTDETPSGCVPGCHWDCLSQQTHLCDGGQVWRAGNSPRPCCRPGEPWPDPGPRCSVGSTPVLTCASHKCQIPSDPNATNPEAWCAPADAGAADAGPDAAPDTAPDATSSPCGVGSHQAYPTAGCAAAPTCLPDGPEDACASTFCGCDGKTFFGACGYSRRPFASLGPCADAGG